MNAIWKLGGGPFYFVALEGRPLLWSQNRAQNASEMCIIHLQGCIMSFNSSNIFEKKLRAKSYKIKRNFKNLHKMRRAGTLNMFPLFTRSKRLFWPKYAVLIPNISQFVQKTYHYKYIKHRNFKLHVLQDWGRQILKFESNFEHDSISLFCQISCLAGQRWSKISNLSRRGR